RGRLRRSRHGGNLRVRGQGYAGDGRGGRDGNLGPPDRSTRVATKDRQDSGKRSLTRDALIRVWAEAPSDIHPQCTATPPTGAGILRASEPSSAPGSPDANIDARWPSTSRH